jgi:hypothetical protein
MSIKRFVAFATDAGRYLGLHSQPRDPAAQLPDGHPAGALEKLLRLLQSLVQIIAALSTNSEDVELWRHLRRQFALGRDFML